MSQGTESGEHAGASKRKPGHKIFDSGFLFLIAATVAAAIAVTWKSGAAHMFSVSLGALGFLGILLPKIFAGLFIAAAIPILIPREKVSRWMGRDSGIRGLFFAALAGVLLPGGPAMIFPLTGALLASGADLAASFAFITGWGLLNLNRTLIWELSFLPSHFVGLRVLFCLPLPILLGIAVRAFGSKT